MGLAKAPEKATTVAVEIIGLSGTTSSTATFKIPLEFVAKAAAPEADMSSEPLRIASTGYDVNRPNVVSGPRALPEPAQATPAYAGTPMTVGGNTSMNATTASLMRRDWTTGRSNLPLARPWLVPRN